MIGGSPDSGTNPGLSRALPTLSACYFVSDEAVRMEPGVEHGGCANGQMKGGEVEREKWTASSREVRGVEQDVGDVGLTLVCWCHEVVEVLPRDVVFLRGRTKGA